ncbi:type VI secretion system-associated FHA domain protein TagH [Paracoccus caeni]|uniref:Type VI secretion system-associated FHA domain protein TagH n=1 Tax=Paracoccus caeni TaxID=657651 RepID=A0A934VYN7_9RHOB|nr:type VI secretion system-associated FHA domain protein TagH [Paracoccus caeni]MBK4214950.1 type VI secretion system-associated FHA domain protein TagH [Paracoccus caeni]
MTLTLQIENFHVLDDGGPVSVLVPETGLNVGRRTGMGWVLPDASRYISGHHFDVRFDGRIWWLHDVSTNGTFLQGHRHRLDGPHALTHGDRFQVGQYLIVAVFDLPQGGAALSPASLPQHQVGRAVDEVASDDPWAVSGFAAEPIDVAPVERAARHPDFADDFIDLPQAAPEPEPVPVAPPVAAPAADAKKGKAAAPAAPAAPALAPVPATDQDAFLRGFCAGAGLDKDAADADLEALGRAVGESLRVVVSQLMAALQDRSSARHFTRSGERTMRGASDNNPLKFLPDDQQALDALFLRPRAGFLTGAAGFHEALDDLRRHQGALFAALQPALIELLHDLDPDKIEADAKGGGLVGNRKAKAWDGFVARWDAKTASENGILDEFIRLFAQAYRKADEQGGIGS